MYLPPFNQKCAPSYLRVRGTKERPDCGEGDPVQNGQGRDGAVFGRETERRPEEIKAFDRLNYRFASEESSRDTYVFIREGEGLEHE